MVEHFFKLLEQRVRETQCQFEEKLDSLSRGEQVSVLEQLCGSEERNIKLQEMLAELEAQLAEVIEERNDAVERANREAQEFEFQRDKYEEELFRLKTENEQLQHQCMQQESTILEKRKIEKAFRFVENSFGVSSLNSSRK